MKQKLRVFLTLLLCAVASVGWGQEEILSLDCANPAPTGSTSTALSSKDDVAVFLNEAASLSSDQNKITCSSKTGDVYKGKGSGGGNIPQKCLKVGKASSGGAFTFKIPDNYDQIDEVEITCYGWKTSSSISVNDGTAQTFSTAQTETTKTFELTSPSREIKIAVTTSAVCITAIVLKKTSGSSTTVATPIFTPAEGTYISEQSVTITCATGDATIYYTTDGNDPTTNSSVYETPINVRSTTTIKAFAAKEGMTSSAVATATYTINSPYSGEDYVRVNSLDYLTDGAKIIIAARYNTTASAYYAMPASASGKPTGVSFTSTTTDNGEILPASIVNSENTYCWTVGVTSDGYILTNTSNQALGYGGTGTDFIANGNNTEWVIARSTSGNSAMIKEYEGFYITNKNIEARGVALNINHIYGSYATSNNNSDGYNFYLDIFVQGATPASVPSISASDVELEYNATYGSITYSVANPVTDGSVTAATTSDWLTLGTVGTTVPFTCSANEAKSEREATVTLTYTYGENQTVTKNVTVTQAGNPNVVDKISDITAAGTYAVQGTIVAKSQRGFVVGDGTGYVYYYNTNYTQDDYNIGDKVKLSGSVVAYGGVFEFNNTTTITAVTESNYVAEDPTVLTGAQMESRVASTTPAQLSNYVQFEGTLSVSGTYYNITNIDGATKAKGSISFPLNTDFTSLNGKTVKVTGYYVGVSSSTYYNIMLGSIEEVEDATPIIDANDVTLAYDATSGEIVYTVNNAVDGKTLNATTDADWISNVVVGDEAVTFTTTANEGNADRTATITLSYDGADDKTVTVTQKHFVDDFATLPFEFNGGSADIESTAGLTQSGLEDDYSSAPKLKFDTTGDELVLKFNERPGVLTFDIKGNSFSGSTFTVQTSENGIDYTNLQTYTELGSTQSESFNNLGENVRYIKWVYTNKSSGNVALGNISLAAYVAPQTYTLTIPSTANVNISAAYDTEGIINEGGVAEIEQGTEIILTIDVDEGYDLQSLTVTGPDGQSFSPVADTEGAYKFTMPKYNATVNAAVVEHVEPSGDEVWKLTNLADLTPSDVFVIVGNNGDNYAMSNDNGTSSAPAAVAVTVSGDEITSTVAENIKWNISIDEDSYTFYPNGTTETWLYCTNTNNGVRVGTNDNKTFTVSEEGYLVNAATSRYVGIYNSQDWRCYTSSGGNIADQSFSFYKKVESTQTIEVKISDAGYATFANENAIDFSAEAGLTVMTAQYDAENDKIVYNEVTSKKVPAGVAVVLKGTADDYEGKVIASADALENNGLKVDLTNNTPATGKEYCLARLNGVVGFYKVATSTYVKAGKAYLEIERPATTGGAKDFYAIEDETDGINAISNSHQTVESVYNLSGQRVNKAQKGIYIVNGKKVVMK